MLQNSSKADHGVVIPVESLRAFNRIFSLYLRANRYNQCGSQPLRIVSKKVL